MKLTSLTVIQVEYGADAGSYRAELHFEGAFSSQKLILDPETSAAVLNVVADKMIDAGEALAKNIRPAIEAAVTPQLEAPAHAD